MGGPQCVARYGRSHRDETVHARCVRPTPIGIRQAARHGIRVERRRHLRQSIVRHVSPQKLCDRLHVRAHPGRRERPVPDQRLNDEGPPGHRPDSFERRGHPDFRHSSQHIGTGVDPDDEWPVSLGQIRPSARSGVQGTDAPLTAERAAYGRRERSEQRIRGLAGHPAESCHATPRSRGPAGGGDDRAGASRPLLAIFQPPP